MFNRTQGCCLQFQLVIVRRVWLGTDRHRRLRKSTNKRSSRYHGHHRDRGREGYWQSDSQGHSSNQSWEGDSVKQKPSSRGRHTPGLRGKEIGLWYARRNRTRRESEQKLNRPTVAIDHAREKNLRQILGNLQAGDTSRRLPPGRMPLRDRSNTFTDTHSEPRVKEEPPDSWEMRVGQDQDFKGRSHMDTNLMPWIKQEPRDSCGMLDGQGRDSKERSHMDTNLKPRVKEEPRDSCGMLDGQGRDSKERSHMDYQSDVLDYDDPRLDREMSATVQQLNSDPQFARMRDFRKKLPSYSYKNKSTNKMSSRYHGHHRDRGREGYWQSDSQGHSSNQSWEGSSVCT